MVEGGASGRESECWRDLGFAENSAERKMGRHEKERGQRRHEGEQKSPGGHPGLLFSVIQAEYIVYIDRGYRISEVRTGRWQEEKRNQTKRPSQRRPGRKRAAVIADLRHQRDEQKWQPAVAIGSIQHVTQSDDFVQ